MLKPEEREGDDRGNPRDHPDTRDTDHENGKEGCITAFHQCECHVHIC